MDEQYLTQKLAEQDQKLDEILKSMNKFKAYFKWTLIISIVVIVFPAIGLVFAIPAFLGSLGNIGNLGL